MTSVNDFILDGGGFKEYPSQWVESLWLLDRDDPRSLDFHGGNIPEVQRILFRRYTKQHDIVTDWFLGSGTSILVGNEMDRHVVGVDINPKLDQFTYTDLEKHSILIGDSASVSMRDSVGLAVSRINKKLQLSAGAHYADFTFLHPPYYDIIKFTGDESTENLLRDRDLSQLDDLNDFYDAFDLVVQNAYLTLKLYGWAALLIGDIYAKGELIPLGYKCMECMQNAGFTLKAEVIKDIKNNEAKGKDYNLWKYRHLKNGTYFFNHEKLFVFRK